MILVGGIGNIFFGDDAFGVEVIRELRARTLPDSVRVVDFGIRGVDLAYSLADFEAAILVDTVARGGAPGTLYVIEPAPGTTGAIEPHGMTPDRVLGWIDPERAPKRLRLVGCEPETFGLEGLGQDGLSAPVRAAVPEAVELVEGLITELLDA